MNYIGIDNGLDGGIAVLTKTENLVFDMPYITEKTKKGYRRRYDIPKICEIIEKFKENSICGIERAQAMPGQGSVSMFSIGYGYGLMQGILTALEIPFEIIYSKKWQKEFSISGDTKSQAFQVVSRLYPTTIFQTERGRIKTGIIDAILIATFMRRKNKI